MKAQEMHNSYLEELVNRLDEIGEDYKRIHWIMKDGIWKPDNTHERFKLCDLILVFYGNYGIPVELKGSENKRGKAILQISSGAKFIENVLRLECPYGKFVTYRIQAYNTEKIPRDKLIV